MLVFRNKGDGSIVKFFTVDFHHHIGRDEEGYESTPTEHNGSYDMCRKLLNGDRQDSGLISELADNHDEYSFEPVPGQQIAQYHRIMNYFGTGDRRLETTYQFEQTLALDQIVVFPTLDEKRLETDIEYQLCNDQIQMWNEMYPHSLRLIGFGRLNPNQFPDCSEELTAIAGRKGLRGLKLHPKSEDFMMRSAPLKSLLRECAKLNLPVIFHTTYGSEVVALEKAANELIVDLFAEGEEKHLPGLKLIAGHCTYTSEDLFKALSHPCIFGELSLLSNPVDYLAKAKKSIDSRRFIGETLPSLTDENENITEEKITGLLGSELKGTWSRKLLLGSDHPFSPFTKSRDLIAGLLHNDCPAETEDIENILGINALRLIKPKIFTGAVGSDVFDKISVKAFMKHTLRKRKRIYFEPLLYQEDGSRASVGNNTVGSQLLQDAGSINVDLSRGRRYGAVISERSGQGRITEISDIAGHLKMRCGEYTRELDELPGL